MYIVHTTSKRKKNEHCDWILCRTYAGVPKRSTYFNSMKVNRPWPWPWPCPVFFSVRTNLMWLRCMFRLAFCTFFFKSSIGCHCVSVFFSSLTDKSGWKEKYINIFILFDENAFRKIYWARETVQVPSEHWNVDNERLLLIVYLWMWKAHMPANKLLYRVYLHLIWHKQGCSNKATKIYNSMFF